MAERDKLDCGEPVFSVGPNVCDPCYLQFWKEKGPGVPDNLTALSDQIRAKIKTSLLKLYEEWTAFLGGNSSGELPADAVGSFFVQLWRLVNPGRLLAGAGTLAVGFLMSGYLGIMSFLIRLYVTSAGWFPSACTKTPERVRKSKIMLKALKLWEHAGMSVPESLIKMYEYDLKYACPVEIPSAEQIGLARLRGYIDEETWEVGVRLNGVCPGWAEVMDRTQQTVFSVPEVMTLWNQGVVGDDQLPKFLRTAGVINQKYVDGYKLIYEKVPDLRAAIDAIARNLEDPAVIETYGLEDGFAERFTGRIKTWALRSGYTEDMVKFLYRQSRPALDQRQIIRLYRAGQVDKDDAEQLYKLAGYPGKIAKYQAAALDRLYGPARAALQGKPTLAELERWFIDGVISGDDYKNKLIDVGVPDDDAENYVDTANKRATAEKAKYLEPKLTAAFESGRIDQQQYHAYLTDVGLDPEYVDQLVDQAKVVREVSDKQFALQQLCTFVDRGYMEISEYLDRAERLGFTRENAAIVAASCVAEVQEKRRKEIERSQREAVSQAKEAEASRKKALAATFSRAKLEWKRRRADFLCAHPGAKPCDATAVIGPEPMPPAGLNGSG